MFNISHNILEHFTSTQITNMLIKRSLYLFLIFIFLILIFISIVIYLALFYNVKPVVTTSFGKIEGFYRELHPGGAKYEAYQGIPYALPPNGTRRFSVS